MALGLQGAFGAVGGQKALDDWLETRVAADLRREAKQQQEFDNLLRRQEHDQRVKFQDASVASFADQRAANAELRRQNAAAKLSEDLMIGDPLDPEQVALMRGAGRGSLIEERAGTLPSATITGPALTPGGGPSAGPITGKGFLRTERPGTPGGARYLGTSPQRQTKALREQLQRFIQDLPADSPERQALEFQLLTGDNPPAGMFQREPTPSFSLQPIYDESGRPSGAVRFNQRTGAVEPVELPGAGIRAGTGGRNALPVRVQNYLLQLRNQFPQYEGAQAELGRVLANAPDEQFDRIAASNALRQLYAQPTGTGNFLAGLGLDVGSILRGEPGAGGAPSSPEAQPRSGPVGAPAGGGTMSRDELRAVAQRLGISEQAAEQQARERGLQVQ